MSSALGTKPPNPADLSQFPTLDQADDLVGTVVVGAMPTKYTPASSNNASRDREGLTLPDALLKAGAAIPATPVQAPSTLGGISITHVPAAVPKTAVTNVTTTPAVLVEEVPAVYEEVIPVFPSELRSGSGTTTIAHAASGPGTVTLNREESVGKSPLSKASDTPATSSSNGPSVVSQAVDTASNLAQSAATTGKQAANYGYDTAKEAVDYGRSTAATGYETAKEATNYATDVATSAANYATDTAKGAVSTGLDTAKGAADYATGTAKGAASYAVDTANAGYETAKGAADYGLQTAKGVADYGYNTATSAASTASKVAGSTIDTGKEALNTATKLAGDATSVAYDIASKGAAVGSDVASSAYNTGTAAAQTAADLASSAAGTAYDTAAGASRKAAETASWAADTAINTGTAAANKAAGLTSYAIDTAKDTASVAADTGSKLAGAAYETATGAASAATSTASSLAGSAYNAGVGTTKYAVGTAANLASGAVHTAVDTTVGAVDLGSKVAGAAYGTATGAAVGAGKIASAVAHSALDTAGAAVNLATNLTTSAATTAVNTVGSTISTAKNVASTVVSTGQQATTTAYDTATKAVGSTQQAATSMVETGRPYVNKAVETGYGLKNTALNTAQEAVNTSKQVAESALHTAQDVAYQATDAAASTADAALPVATSWFMWAVQLPFSIASFWYRTIRNSTLGVTNFLWSLMVASLHLLGSFADTAYSYLDNGLHQLNRWLASSIAQTPTVVLKGEKVLHMQRLASVGRTVYEGDSIEQMLTAPPETQATDLSQPGGSKTGTGDILVEVRQLMEQAGRLLELQLVSAHVARRLVQGFGYWVISSFFQLSLAAAAITVTFWASALATAGSVFARVIGYGINKAQQANALIREIRSDIGSYLLDMFDWITSFVLPYLRTTESAGYDGEMSGVDRTKEMLYNGTQSVRGVIAGIIPRDSDSADSHVHLTDSAVNKVQSALNSANDGASYAPRMLKSEGAAAANTSDNGPIAPKVLSQLVPSLAGGFNDQSEFGSSGIRHASGMRRTASAVREAGYASEKASRLGAVFWTLADLAARQVDGTATRFHIPIPFLHSLVNVLDQSAASTDYASTPGGYEVITTGPPSVQASNF